MSLASERPGAIAIAVAGCVALAVAMGIGRFAFTPILPMMLHDGAVDLHAASWLASANYLGYLSGALLCTFVPLLWARLPAPAPIDGPALVRAGLAATGVLTLAMALPLAGGLAGAALPRRRRQRDGASCSARAGAWRSSRCAARAALGGAMFAGPGAGIVASGLLASAMVAWRSRVGTGWLVFGVLACVLSASIWRIFRRGRPRARAAPVAGASRVSDRDVRAAARSVAAARRRTAAQRSRHARVRLRHLRLRLHRHRDLPAGDRARRAAHRYRSCAPRYVLLPGSAGVAVRTKRQDRRRDPDDGERRAEPGAGRDERPDGGAGGHADGGARHDGGLAAGGPGGVGLVLRDPRDRRRPHDAVGEAEPEAARRAAGRAWVRPGRASRRS